MLNTSNCGLIVIDIQGKLAHKVANSSELIANTRTLILGCQALKLPILWLEQTPEKLGSTVAELAQLMPLEQPITKTTFSGCANNTFMQQLRHSNKCHWLICGIEAHICVYQTASDLLALNFNVLLIDDAISSRKVSHKALALQKLQHEGAQLSNIEMCLYELIADSRHPEFKTILQLIK